MRDAPHYKVYHVPHPQSTAHGGAAVVIRSAITHHELLHHQADKIQAANIGVDANARPFTISAIYCPPFFQSLGSKFLTGKDWNAKHKEWKAYKTPKGRNLLHAIDRQNCNYLSTGKLTHWPTDPNKFPDLMTSLYSTA
jgi:hypothetical protein